jgi:gamma-D-glutamyl-L-lysine dipeptidyl-peptidase
MKPIQMYPVKKIIYSFIILCAGIFLVSSCNYSSVEEIISEIDKISEKWVPDGREGLFKVNAEIKQKTVILTGETNIPEARQEVIDLFLNSKLAIKDNIKVLPDTISDKRYFGVVTLSVINLRRTPEHSSELVSQAILGTPVLVLKSEGSWNLIQTPDKYIAWTEASSITLKNRSEMQEIRNSDRIIYLKNSGWVYSTTGESSVAGDIVAGSILQSSGKSRGYTKVIFPDSREGFVRDSEISDFNLWKNNLNISGEKICDDALTFMGSPYLWGGSSTKATDCSGFVQSVYFRNGIILARDASLQAKQGSEIDISDGDGLLAKGDLLYFGSKNSSGLRVTHVAIYIGDSKYIHSSGRVMINSLDPASADYNEYRMNSLLTARRIIGIENDKSIVPVTRHKWY